MTNWKAMLETKHKNLKEMLCCPLFPIYSYLLGNFTGFMALNTTYEMMSPRFVSPA